MSAMYRRFKIFTQVFLAVIVTAVAASCKKDWYDNSPNEPLMLSASSVLVPNFVAGDGGHETLGVTARDAGWTVEGVPDWFTLTPSSGPTGLTKVTINFTKYVAAETEPNRSATLVFSSGEHTKEITVEQSPLAKLPLPDRHLDYDDNIEIYKLLKKWYYWSDEMSADMSDADPNQSYSNFFRKYLEKLKVNEADGKTWSEGSKRYLYSYINRGPVGWAAKTPLSFGMEFDFLNASPYSISSGDYLVGLILYVEKGSPAERAGLVRSDWFDRVNGNQMGRWLVQPTDAGIHDYDNATDSLILPAEGVSQELRVLTLNKGGQNNLTYKRDATLTPTDFVGSPILHKSVIEVKNASGNVVNVGYLVYNRFDNGQGGKYLTELKNAFNEFKTFTGRGGTGVIDVVLDLRYNRSGTVDNALEVANLIVPSTANGTFATCEFNSASGEGIKTFNFAPDATNGVNMPRVYILTSKFTAGAAELLINGLSGLDGFKVIMIGDNTEGLNMGTVEVPYTSTISGYEHDYKVGILAFRALNGKGEGNYGYGFVPNGGKVVESDDVKNVTSWGWKVTSENESRNDTEQDPLLRKALNYILGVEGSLPALNPGTVSSEQSRTGSPRDFMVQASMTIEGVNVQQ